MAPDIFTAQLDLIAEHGWSVVSLADVCRWKSGAVELPEKSLAITFDDGFQDFLKNAHHQLETKQFPNTMFVPTARLGQSENWVGANAPARKIMSWDDVCAIDKTCTEIAPHSRTHADLTALNSPQCNDEIAGSKKDLEDRLGRAVPHFAPPYGKSNSEVRAVIADHFDLSVGVDFGTATARSDVINLPRIEMFYYTDLKRWGDFLAGKGGPYMAARKALRNIRRAIKPDMTSRMGA